MVTRSAASAAALAFAVALPAAAQTPPAPPTAPSADAAPAGRPAATEQPTPRQARHRAKKETRKWTGPVATYPSFRVLPDGRSQVVVRLSGKVDVSEAKGNLRAVYVLPNVGTTERTNRLPLLTSYFRSVVTRVELVQQDTGLGLVIEMREPAVPTYRVDVVPGGVELVVEFPKPAPKEGAETPAPAEKAADEGEAPQATP